MMRDGQYLNRSIDFSVNKVKVKNLEHGASNVGYKNNARLIRRRTNRSQDILKFRVVPPTQSCLYLFIVSDLLFVLFSGLGMKPIGHLKSA